MSAFDERINCDRCGGSGETRGVGGTLHACTGCGGSGLSRVARMQREQEERAQRYLGEAGGPAPAAPSRFSAPVVAVAICFFVWACAIAAAAWNALFRD